MKVPEEYSLRKRHDRANDLSLFRELFEAYFKISVTYAYRFVGDWQAAEDITQDVFMSLWEKKEDIDFNDPIKPYLYRAVYNRSINYLNSALMQKRIESIDTIDELITQEILGYNQQDTLLLKEITDEINRFVDTLPPQCRTVYKLSRETGNQRKDGRKTYLQSIERDTQPLGAPRYPFHTGLPDREFFLPVVFEILHKFYKFVAKSMNNKINLLSLIIKKTDNNPYGDVFLFGMKFRTIRV